MRGEERGGNQRRKKKTPRLAALETGVIYIVEVLRWKRKFNKYCANLLFKVERQCFIHLHLLIHLPQTTM